MSHRASGSGPPTAAMPHTWMSRSCLRAPSSRAGARVRFAARAQRHHGRGPRSGARVVPLPRAKPGDGCYCVPRGGCAAGEPAPATVATVRSLRLLPPPATLAQRAHRLPRIPPVSMAGCDLISDLGALSLYLCGYLLATGPAPDACRIDVVSSDEATLPPLGGPIFRCECAQEACRFAIARNSRFIRRPACQGRRCRPCPDRTPGAHG